LIANPTPAKADGTIMPFPLPAVLAKKITVAFDGGRLAQTCFCPGGGLAPVSFSPFQGICFTAGDPELAWSCLVARLGYKEGPVRLECLRA
jgi:hypothetical protein